MKQIEATIIGLATVEVYRTVVLQVPDDWTEGDITLIETNEIANENSVEWACNGEPDELTELRLEVQPYRPIYCEQRRPVDLADWRIENSGDPEPFDLVRPAEEAVKELEA